RTKRSGGGPRLPSVPARATVDCTFDTNIIGKHRISSGAFFYLCPMQVYLDNAATTPLDPQVIAAMVEVMEGNYGNPSSIHAHGRRAKTIVEKARKTVAGLLNVSPAEI